MAERIYLEKYLHYVTSVNNRERVENLYGEYPPKKLEIPNV